MKKGKALAPVNPSSSEELVSVPPKLDVSESEFISPRIARRSLASASDLAGSQAKDEETKEPKCD
jgi:hypothetical protein